MFLGGYISVRNVLNSWLLPCSFFSAMDRREPAVRLTTIHEIMYFLRGKRNTKEYGICMHYIIVSLFIVYIIYIFTYIFIFVYGFC